MKLEWYLSKADSWTLCDHHAKDELEYIQPPDKKKAIERAIKGYAAVEKKYEQRTEFRLKTEAEERQGKK